MNQKKQYVQNVILLVSDILAVVCSHFLANYFWIGLIKGYRIIGHTETLNRIGIVLSAYVFIDILFNNNNRFIERKIYEEFFNCIKINLFFTASYAILLFIVGNFDRASRGVYIITLIFNVFIMFLFRMAVRVYLVKIYKNNKKNDHLFLITTSKEAESVILRMNRNVEWVNRISGMAVMDKDMTGEVIANVPVTANKDNVLEYIRVQIIDEVFIDMPSDNGRKLEKLIMELENMGTTVYYSVDTLDSFRDFNKTLSILGDIPVLTFANSFTDPRKTALKRIIDVMVSAFGIIIMAAAGIFIVPVLLIKNNRPVMLKEKRVGMNGRYFYMYRFNSRHASGLTEFINVFKGDMSIIGTRPASVEEFNKYEGHQRRRLSMKPGMTGPWKITDTPENDIESLVEQDLMYIDNWSNLNDLKIFFKTARLIFRSKDKKYDKRKI